MIHDFVNQQLNFKDTMMMIEETRKKDNENFGMNIVRAAQAIREKRDMDRPKKNFMSEHTKAVRHWQEKRQEQQIINKLRNEEKKQSAIEKKKQVLREHH